MQLLNLQHAPKPRSKDLRFYPSFQGSIAPSVGLSKDGLVAGKTPPPKLSNFYAAFLDGEY